MHACFDHAINMPRFRFASSAGGVQVAQTEKQQNAALACRYVGRFPARVVIASAARNRSLRASLCSRASRSVRTLGWAGLEPSQDSSPAGRQETTLEASACPMHARVRGAACAEADARITAGRRLRGRAAALRACGCRLEQRGEGRGAEKDFLQLVQLLVSAERQSLVELAVRVAISFSCGQLRISLITVSESSTEV